ncbi:MAG: hypothetical protein H0Z38_05230 [Firmicutes bacterium]|nr:hypothetical protein [Bacillota bacterium]
MRSVLAYFPSSQKAQKVADILEKQGYKTQIDSVHKFPGEGIIKRMNPLTGRFGSLAKLTLDTDLDQVTVGEDSTYVGTLYAADPGASGMAGAPQEEAADGTNWQLTVVVKDDADAEKVNLICKKHGALT